MSGSTGAANRRRTLPSGENVMEMRVHLKVCEACGCLWFRAQAETTVYCSGCYERFKEFPTPESRKRRGRPKKTTLPAVFAVAGWSLGGVETGLAEEFEPAAAIAGQDAVISLVAAETSHGCYSALNAGAL